MTLLTLEDVFDALRVHAASFDLPETQIVSGTGGGEIIRADLAPWLWEGTVELSFARHDDQIAVEADIARLREPGVAFAVRDKRRRGPRLDPDGAALAGSSPAMAQLSPDFRSLALGGLPAGYVISKGDALAFDYVAEGKLRRAFHRARTGATADGTGTTPLFEVVPPIRPGSIQAAVTLTDAACRAVYVPGSLRTGMARGVFTEGLTFRWRQTLGEHDA